MKVEIYSNDNCVNCTMVKECLRSNNIEYVEHNISKDPEARKILIGMGYLSVPLTIIDGNHVLGFDLNRIKLLLNI